ncbi:MAG: hypothetical protein ACE5FZ_03615 [Nitrospiria bacterium]
MSEDPNKKEALILNKKQMKWFYITLAVLVLLDAAAIFGTHHHHYFFWDSIPGFYSIFGFISCLILIFFSKGIGHAFLMKDKDYYDD